MFFGGLGVFFLGGGLIFFLVKCVDSNAMPQHAIFQLVIYCLSMYIKVTSIQRPTIVHLDVSPDCL